jgi:chromosomal replication initiation ATPase DnaA
MFVIDTQIGDIHVDLKLTEQVNVFVGKSGTGKTYLFALMKAYCVANNISLTIINYNSVLEPEDIIHGCAKSDIVILDNADLYLTKDILDALRVSAKYILISIKNIYGLGGNMHYCNLKYESSKMLLR